MNCQQRLQLAEKKKKRIFNIYLYIIEYNIFQLKF